MNAQLLARYELFRTRDLDEAREQVGRILSPHRLTSPNPRAAFDVRYQYVNLGDTSVMYAEYGGDVVIDPGALESFYLVGMPQAGKTLVHIAGQDIVSRPGYASVQSPTRPLRTTWLDGCRKLTVKIDRCALERHLAQLLGRPLDRPIEFEPLMNVERGPALSWRHMVDFLLSELSGNSALIATPEARRRIEELLMNALLTIQPHSYSDALTTPAGSAAPACIRRVEDYIAANPFQALTLQTLSQVAGVSPRSLQEGFKRYRGVSPIAFVTERRLELARRTLQEGRPHDSVTEVALRCGFFHLGRFAQSYKVRFGETPSETFRRASGRSR